MQRAKQSDGSSMFEKTDFLTSQQISGFFSRLTAKKTYRVDTSDKKESINTNEVDAERNIQDLTSEVMEAFAPQHPIMVDTHNICDLVCQSKLAKFQIKTLQNFCNSLEMDLSAISGKRKQPYIHLLEDLVARCSQCRENMQVR